jgi:hypothetical protein
MKETVTLFSTVNQFKPVPVRNERMKLHVRVRRRVQNVISLKKLNIVYDM